MPGACRATEGIVRGLRSSALAGDSAGRGILLWRADLVIQGQGARAVD